MELWFFPLHPVIVVCGLFSPRDPLNSICMRSLQGLSLTSVIVELLCYSVVVAYNLSQVKRSNIPALLCVHLSTCPGLADASSIVTLYWV